MKLIIEIPDNELNFVMKMLKNFSFIKKINPLESEDNTILEKKIRAARKEKDKNELISVTATNVWKNI